MWTAWDKDTEQGAKADFMPVAYLVRDGCVATRLAPGQL